MGTLNVRVIKVNLLSFQRIFIEFYVPDSELWVKDVKMNLKNISLYREEVITVTGLESDTPEFTFWLVLFAEYMICGKLPDPLKPQFSHLQKTGFLGFLDWMHIKCLAQFLAYSKCLGTIIHYCDDDEHVVGSKYTIQWRESEGFFLFVCFY